MSSPAPALRCELTAPTAAEARAWRLIVRACARDLGQPVRVLTGPAAEPERSPSVTLHLPATLAASQHPVWCLACRLACFLPQARVSVLVHGEQSFAAPSVGAASVRTGAAA